MYIGWSRRRRSPVEIHWMTQLGSSWLFVNSCVISAEGRAASEAKMTGMTPAWLTLSGM